MTLIVSVCPRLALQQKNIHWCIMKSFQFRVLLFLFGCIFIRIMFIIIAKYINPKKLPYLGAIALIPAVGFTVIFLADWRKKGPEVFGDQIWWNDLRPVHAALYLAFALFAFKKNRNSWIPLLIDVTIGIFSFLWFHNRSLCVQA